MAKVLLHREAEYCQQLSKKLTRNPIIKICVCPGHSLHAKKKNVQDAGETKGNKMQPPSLEAMSPKSTSVGPEERLQHALYRDKHAEGHGASSAGWNKSRDPWGYTNCTIDARNPQTTACQCHASLG